MRNVNDWLNGAAPHTCGHYVEAHGPANECPSEAYGGGPARDAADS